MRILGIDPALTITGYGIIEVKKNYLGLVEAGIVTTSAKDALTKRLNKIFCSVTKLIQDTNPDVMVLEKLYAHYRHPATAFALGQARGVICLACALGGLPLVEYAATRVKKAIVGRGQASKYQVQRMVADTLRLESLPKYLDVTDAIALALAHRHINKLKI